MSNVHRAVRLLELLSAQADGTRLIDLAQSLGVNRAIPHRVLSELAEMGYVTQDPVTERYLATFKLGALGLQQLESAGLARWSTSALCDLATKTRELVRLAITESDGLRWVAKEQGSNSALTLDPASGSAVVLHATASGKAWLSTLDDARVKSILTDAHLEAKTSHTGTDREKLLHELEEIRERGYAIVEEEMDVGINAIAAPIRSRDRGEPAVGTVSVAGPSARLTVDVLHGYAPLVLDAAEKLTREWAVFRHLSAGAK